jgi:hypothetical protein
MSEFISNLLGALSAYCFERYKERSQEDQTQHAAVLRAQFALIAQSNTLENIRRTLLKPFEKVAGREAKMPLFHQAESGLRVDVGSLGFLLSSSEGADLLLELTLAQSSYANCIDALRIRNEQLKDFYEKAQIQSFDHSTGAAHVATDPGTHKILKDSTDVVFDLFPKTIGRIDTACESLRDVAKPMFKKKRFLKFDRPFEKPE